ncbi:MAG TPA: aspartyl/asparaginyl beta-hydroxylase domain-containing protein [Usitatibacter sp.]|nr:aspartyl/asparaginyl beta-hydroxylase domain-containing protein [Usitatibacter sp.]
MVPTSPDAIDRELARDPRNVSALIRKADQLAAQGDMRAASAYYLQAVKIAAATPLPAELHREVARARAACEGVADRIEAALRARLASSGLDEGPRAQRFRESLDIMFGHRQPYFQQPQYYFFPGLPQIQFYPRDAFPWLDAVEAATPEIRDELLAVMHEPSSFQPYVQSDPSRPRNAQAGMLDNPAWSAFYLVKDGLAIEANAARCPRTMAALRDVPFPRVAGRTPSVLFSLLRPGAHIPAHNGFLNTRLICHLPLVVPPGCSFRVGNEVREWAEGRAWLFDDTIEHEAWNRGPGTRVVLLFDVWRPELTEDERRLVTAMFEAIDAQGGQRTAWHV